MSCPVYSTVHVYTGQVTFYQGIKNTRPCLAGDPVDGRMVYMIIIPPESPYLNILPAIKSPMGAFKGREGRREG